MLTLPLLVGAFALVSSAQTTIGVFMGPNAREGQYAGSVVNVNECTTTLGIACTEGSLAGLSTTVPCNPHETGYLTMNPNSYVATTTNNINGVVFDVLETCSLEGTTSAVCSVSAYVNGAVTTAISATTTISITYVQVPITAGASKLAGQPTCPPAANTGNAAAPTAIVDVYKILVLPAAAAALAGALL